MKILKIIFCGGILSVLISSTVIANNSKSNEANFNLPHAEETMTLIISNKMDINSQDKNGNTALHFVSNFGNLDLAKIFIKKGANINIKDNEGKTPLFLAVTISPSLYGEGKKMLKNKIDVATFLLENKADPNIKDNDGGTTLHWATISNKPELVKLLLKYGAKNNVSDKDGVTPLSLAKSFNFKDIVEILKK